MSCVGGIGEDAVKVVVLELQRGGVKVDTLQGARVGQARRQGAKGGVERRQTIDGIRNNVKARTL